MRSLPLLCTLLPAFFCIGTTSGQSNTNEPGLQLTEARDLHQHSGVLPSSRWLSGTTARTLWSRNNTNQFWEAWVIDRATDKPIKVRSCAELIEASRKDIELPQDTAGMGTFIPFISACRILKWAQQSQSAATSYFPTDPLMEDTARYLDWQYLPLVRGDEISRSEREADLSVADFAYRNAAWVRYDHRDHRLVIGMYDEFDRSLASSFGTTLRLVARSDLDGDGIEDIIVRYSKGFIETEHLGIARSQSHGSLGWSEYRVLTRASSTERYRQICPPAQDDEQQALEDLWLQFAGVLCDKRRKTE